ncbi:MAG: D-alanine--D-alanine ligase [Bacteroidota bacterium]
MKIKIGIFFGGKSREREISFAGGRTVYDNLNKSIFEPVPIFVDSFGNFIHLEWQFIYKGSIRDFYPPIEFLPPSINEFQIYVESLGKMEDNEYEKIINKIGKKILTEELKDNMDFAFLCLHGTNGEDGRLQGLLEYFGIPYSGSGIFASAFGINKGRQKELMEENGFEVPEYITISDFQWLYLDKSNAEKQKLYLEINEDIGFPMVIKPANQGSSIGVTILKTDSYSQFSKALNKAFFVEELTMEEWFSLDNNQKVEHLKNVIDIREGIGMPLLAGSIDVYDDCTKICHPEELLIFINDYFLKNKSNLFLHSIDHENEVIIEKFVEGKEFSCVVIEDEFTNIISLPPTEIVKGNELFDYHSKYLPGLSRKITPINISTDTINEIMEDCKTLFENFYFDVYARIDGFLTDDGTIYLNDPNTTSGMLPSSFFFHQAAEIGLNPSQFLTFIIAISLLKRSYDFKDVNMSPKVFYDIIFALEDLNNELTQKIKIAVIMGGYSSERHISIESGRNVYEKLASSEKYEPIPVFLTGDEAGFELYKIPINILLKDNADDIKEKIRDYKVHPVVDEIIEQSNVILKKYGSTSNLEEPAKITMDELAEMVSGAFIALHGRPGEDGTIQRELEKVGLPYNGSNPHTSMITINKYNTNEILSKNGFLVAKHKLIFQKDWDKDSRKLLKDIMDGFTFPLIAKPVDDGCSSAVKQIHNEEQLIAYSNLIFRKQEELLPKLLDILKLEPKEEFPQKSVFMVEELITANGAEHFIEITGGLLTHFKNHRIEYEIFEASETLREGEILTLEEKFLAGQGQNITPARYSANKTKRDAISEQVKDIFLKAAKVLNLEGYARIDAFVRIFEMNRVEVIFIEVNSLPGMTPATCIFHQAAINGYKPYEFIDKILTYGFERKGSL